ncbi:solute carrier family 25 member 44-like isoform X2 [Hemitrygon akajei]|uniref:solute carrier family 25 member 44-like isoform X2 n=1 Tax=Hemitrygon akajei TaxID=2704970 RepID=UPI003BFA3231
MVLVFKLGELSHRPVKQQSKTESYTTDNVPDFFIIVEEEKEGVALGNINFHSKLYEVSLYQAKLCQRSLLLIATYYSPSADALEYPWKKHEQLSKWAPSECPHLVLQGIAGPMAAVTASTLINPMDVIRARVQLEGKSSIIETSSQLLREEGAWGFTKGLSARILSAAPTAFVLVIGYETLKKISLRQELVAIRHW